MEKQSILIAMVVLLTACSWAVAYSGGTGEPNNPYIIATAEDMNQIGANPADWNKHFILINDINLAQYTGTQFKIIGNSTTKFTGVFDGNDHKVWNFTWWGSSNKNGTGLFGYIATGGQIKNLGMEDFNVNAVNGYEVGGLVGENCGTITNCYSTGSVSGYGSAGGLVGVNGGTITNCYSTGSVSGSDYVGGLVGRNFGTISNCYATGAVSGDTEVGGLVGENPPQGTISNCYATGVVNGDAYVGGLVGENFYGTITNCYSTSSVSSTGSYIGGMVGQNEGMIKNCYSVGNVSGGAEVGGLVGWNCNTILNCYAAGNVSGDWYTGGLVADNYDGSVIASFWDVNTSGQSTSEGGTPKTTAKMKTKSTFTDVGWNFVTIWDICEGTNYPRLIWQIPIGDLVCPDGVNFIDYSFFAGHWLEDNCGGSNDCDGTDLDFSGSVDANDLKIFCDHWLQGN